MSMNRLVVRGIARLAILVAAALIVAACSDGEDGGDAGETSAAEESTEASGESQPSDSADSQGGESPAEESDQAATDEEPGGTTPFEPEVDEELLASLETSVAPLGDVLGVDRPAGLEPATLRPETYPRLCPADDVPVSAVLQEDPLVENLPVQRYFIAFPTAQDALGFVADLGATEVGCVGVREGEVSTATSTVTEVRPLALDDGTEAVQIEAGVEVELVNVDRDPPGSQVLRSVVQEGIVVVIVVSLAAYESLIGAPVHGPLLQDGINLVQASG